MVIRLERLVVTVHEEEILVRFAKADYPDEFDAVEAAREQVERAVRVDLPQVQEDAAAAMYDSVLALLAAPGEARKRTRRRW